MVGAEYRNSLCLQWDIEVIIGHHHGVSRGERIGTELFDEQLHHLRLSAEVVLEPIA
ncbi:Uncharacterised protein [Mycobacteroides abscessus subsp. abscessus]|nr:Uncharacterised protein [Mycobacteroides abscessus subsp. abscessus]